MNLSYSITNITPMRGDQSLVVYDLFQPETGMRRTFSENYPTTNFSIGVSDAMTQDQKTHQLVGNFLEMARPTFIGFAYEAQEAMAATAVASLLPGQHANLQIAPPISDPMNASSGSGPCLNPLVGIIQYPELGSYPSAYPGSGVFSNQGDSTHYSITPIYDTQVVDVQ